MYRDQHPDDIIGLTFLVTLLSKLDYICNFSNINIFSNIKKKCFKGALEWYGKLTSESAHAWILIILCYLIVWGITLIFMVRLSFYAIPSLIYDVMNDITIIPLGTQL